MVFWNVVGLIAATLTMTSFIPQVVKIARTKSAQDVSLVTLVQLSFGVLLWMAYGIYRKDPIIIMANFVTLLTLIAALTLYARYK
ncbi:MAG: SemiSWEET transporter [Candidatus Omnitrophota bacterium]